MKQYNNVICHYCGREYNAAMLDDCPCDGEDLDLLLWQAQEHNDKERIEELQGRIKELTSTPWKKSYVQAVALTVAHWLNMGHTEEECLRGLDGAQITHGVDGDGESRFMSQWNSAYWPDVLAKAKELIAELFQ
jgi:hypothetical protein